ncbi:caspase a [Mastacembelus armatus]|uniref:caspase a n=1 Tax=Mastacembelus armatus TaxID=205130 RepID=UPI000E4553DC|nr:caspase-1-like [Mastacembelus armatus]
MHMSNDNCKNKDKELFKVRVQFVERVSKDLIKQLLDDLLEDGVLNEGEKDSVLEENSITRDRARCLIDTVKKKGKIASGKMIAHLERRDANLFSELGLCSGQPEPPAAEEKQEWSATLIPTTEAFWSSKVNDRNIYPVTKNNIRNRVALLITNIKFANERLNRRGAEKDEENMEKLLRALGYEVVKYTNLTGEEIDKALIDFSKHSKLKETDSVFVVIMSHGKLGAVLGVNWKENCSDKDELPINNIYKHLDSEGCPALLNKPKIIIIQACRGEEDGAVLVCDSVKPAVTVKPAVFSDEAPQCRPAASAAEDDVEDDSIRRVHKEKDFISLLSSTPDTVSYRHRDDGSFLIQYVVDVFNNFARNDDVDELFRKVMQRFEEFQDRKQMPTKDRCTVTKHIYLFPGL